MDINETNDKPYDLTTILAISEHSPQFLAQLILVFCDNISNDILLIKEAAHVGNWEEAGKLVHKLKPSLAHFGVNSAKDIVIILEHPENKDPEYLHLLIAELDRIIIKVLSALKNEFPHIFNQ